MTISEKSLEYFGNQLQFLCNCIDNQRKIIDRNLKEPAKWQGFARRELEGKENQDVRNRIKMAYDNIVEHVKNEQLFSSDLLLSIHKDLLEDGGSFRTRGVKVGKNDPVYRPHSRIVPRLVKQAMQRAEDGVEPVPLAAARLHLELLIIHPFRDSNGRSARLVSSFILMRAGYKSSLLSAVEQHFWVQPRAYARAFRILREGAEKDHAEWLITALNAMLFNSVKAAWFRTRRDKLYKALEFSDFPKEKWNQVLTHFDLGKKTYLAETLHNLVGDSVQPIVNTVEEMSSDELSALIFQVDRLYKEERMSGLDIDPYREAVLSELKQIKTNVSTS